MTPHLKDILSLVNEKQQFAEAKHAGLVALNGVVLGIISQIIFNKDLYGALHYSQILLLVSSCLFFISIALSLWSFFPITKNDEKKLNESEIIKGKVTSNCIFFEDIQKFSSSEYLALLLLKLTPPASNPALSGWTGLDEDYANQIVVNSRITSRKFFLFKKSVLFFMIGFVNSIAGLILVYLHRFLYNI